MRRKEKKIVILTDDIVDITDIAVWNYTVLRKRDIVKVVNNKGKLLGKFRVVDIITNDFVNYEAELEPLVKKSK